MESFFKYNFIVCSNNYGNSVSILSSFSAMANVDECIDDNSDQNSGDEHSDDKGFDMADMQIGRGVDHVVEYLRHGFVVR